MIKFLKKIIALIILSYIELTLASFLSKFFIIIPVTFLGYSFYIYRSNSNISPVLAFLIGLFIDLIQESYLGLNATLFCIITYLIHSYSNAFKIFSNLQICLFFGLTASAYVGLTQLLLSFYNFSYLTLILSSIINISLCIVLTIFSSYLPKALRLEK
jgi:rod shape-determining protein MreD